MKCQWYNFFILFNNKDNCKALFFTNLYYIFMYHLTPPIVRTIKLIRTFTLINICSAAYIFLSAYNTKAFLLQKHTNKHLFSFRICWLFSTILLHVCCTRARGIIEDQYIWFFQSQSSEKHVSSSFACLTLNSFNYAIKIKR